MTQDEIIEMAKPYEWLGAEGWTFNHYWQLETFAKLVAAKEREACADLCWKNEDDNAFVNSYNGKRIDLLCSELIRARGQA
jgi:hypothetical protein